MELIAEVMHIWNDNETSRHLSLKRSENDWYYPSVLIDRYILATIMEPDDPARQWAIYSDQSFSPVVGRVLDMEIEKQGPDRGSLVLARCQLDILPFLTDANAWYIVPELTIGQTVGHQFSVDRVLQADLRCFRLTTRQESPYTKPALIGNFISIVYPEGRSDLYKLVVQTDPANVWLAAWVIADYYQSAGWGEHRLIVADRNWKALAALECEQEETGQWLAWNGERRQVVERESRHARNRLLPLDGKYVWAGPTKDTEILHAYELITPPNETKQL